MATEKWYKDANSVGTISLSHVYFRHAALTVVFHAVCTPWTVPGYCQQKRYYGNKGVDFCTDL